MEIPSVRGSKDEGGKGFIGCGERSLYYGFPFFVEESMCGECVLLMTTEGEGWMGKEGRERLIEREGRHTTLYFLFYYMDGGGCVGEREGKVYPSLIACAPQQRPSSPPSGRHVCVWGCVCCGYFWGERKESRICFFKSDIGKVLVSFLPLSSVGFLPCVSSCFQIISTLSWPTILTRPLPQSTTGLPMWGSL